MTSTNIATTGGRGSHAQTVPALFAHLDGATLAHSDNTLICIDKDDSTVFIPIGIAGLKLLAYRILALATELEAGVGYLMDTPTTHHEPAGAGGVHKNETPPTSGMVNGAKKNQIKSILNACQNFFYCYFFNCCLSGCHCVVHCSRWNFLMGGCA